MGAVSENSKGNWRENISAKIKDTVSSAVGAFVDVFVRDPDRNSGSQAKMEIDDNTIRDASGDKVNIEELKTQDLVWTFQDYTQAKGLPENFRDFARPVSFSSDTDSKMAMAQYSVELNSGKTFKDYELHSNLGNLEATFEYLKDREPITNHLTENNFEVNPVTLGAFAFYHELGHKHHFEEWSDKQNDIVQDIQDSIQSDIRSSLLSEAVDIFRDDFDSKDEVSREVFDQVIDFIDQTDFEVYRELPKEHIADEFAIHCMETFLEPDGSFKEEMPKTFDFDAVSIDKDTIKGQMDVLENLKSEFKEELKEMKEEFDMEKEMGGYADIDNNNNEDPFAFASKFDEYQDS